MKGSTLNAPAVAWGLYYKTLRIRNLQEIDKLRNYLVSTGLDEHTSLHKQTH
jgi:hypothetical protein